MPLLFVLIGVDKMDMDKIKVGMKLKMKSYDECYLWCKKNSKLIFAQGYMFNPGLCIDMPFEQIVEISEITNGGTFRIKNDKHGYKYTPMWFESAKKINK